MKPQLFLIQYILLNANVSMLFCFEFTFECSSLYITCRSFENETINIQMILCVSECMICCASLHTPFSPNLCLRWKIPSYGIADNSKQTSATQFQFEGKIFSSLNMIIDGTNDDQTENRIVLRIQCIYCCKRIHYTKLNISSSSISLNEQSKENGEKTEITFV